jgi:hypothetical protein
MPCVAPSQQAVPVCLRLRRGGLPCLVRPPISDRAGAQSGDKITGGYVVRDANGQSLAHI